MVYLDTSIKVGHNEVYGNYYLRNTEKKMHTKKR